jgi:hypothetical protein
MYLCVDNVILLLRPALQENNNMANDKTSSVSLNSFMLMACCMIDNTK